MPSKSAKRKAMEEEQKRIREKFFSKSLLDNLKETERKQQVALDVIFQRQKNGIMNNTATGSGSGSGNCKINPNKLAFSVERSATENVFCGTGSDAKLKTTTTTTTTTKVVEHIETKPVIVFEQVDDWETLC